MTDPVTDPQNRPRVASAVSRIGSDSREQRPGPRRTGVTVWLTGLPCAGKTTVATALGQAIGPAAALLDGDDLRRTISADLGYDREGRREQGRRAADLALAHAQHGHTAIVALVSPYREDRAAAREVHDQAGVAFLEVHVATGPELCAQHDRAGHWAAARRGDIERFTGVQDPYEAPLAPELTVLPFAQGAEACAAAIRQALRSG